MSAAGSKEVIVVGGGVAGQMAAIAAAKAGAKVLLLERMPQLGLKMGITGKGRCNLTNACSMDEFIRNTPGNGKFLYSAYHQFTNLDLLAMLHGVGLATKTERGGRVFPETDSAQDVRAAFRKLMGQCGVRVHLNEKVETIETVNGRVSGVRTAKERYSADAVIITTGGASYPQTGSDGNGCIMAEQLGHTVVPLRPALVPLVCVEEYCKELQGLSLRNVELTLYINNKAKKTLRGEMLFTHFGVSGPLVLVLSDQAAAALQKGQQVSLSVDSKPALSEAKLDERILRDLKKYHLKQIDNAMQDLLPKSMIPVILKVAGVAAHIQVAVLSKEQRLNIGKAIKKMPLTVTATRPLREAIVTAGGISVKEVSASTMESKKVKGLHFAGEVLDIHAFTGGYNLQAAFSTGYVAGTHAGE